MHGCNLDIVRDLQYIMIVEISVVYVLLEHKQTVDTHLLAYISTRAHYSRVHVT